MCDIACNTPTPLPVESEPSPRASQTSTPVPHLRNNINTPSLIERGTNACDSANTDLPSPINTTKQSITLHDILIDNGLYVLFNSYLQKIHAIEALDFWIEVEIFKRLTSERECIKMANTIYKKFIDSSSQTEINVESPVKDEINHKINNHLYDTDLYDKAQECIESTLKFGCVRVFVDEVLPKELRRKSLQEYASEKNQRMSILQRFTALPTANKSIKKYRDIKQKEDKYIKSVSAGRKKKKEMFRNATEGVIASTACEKDKTDVEYTPLRKGKRLSGGVLIGSERKGKRLSGGDVPERKDKRLSGGYSGSDSDSGTKKEYFKKLIPRISNPLKISMDSSTSDRHCLSDGEHSPHSPRAQLTPPTPTIFPSSPRKARAFSITKQRSASMLLGLNFLGNGSGGTDGLSNSPNSKCDIDRELRRARDRSAPTPLPLSKIATECNSPRNISLLLSKSDDLGARTCGSPPTFPQMSKSHDTEDSFLQFDTQKEERNKLWISQ